MFAKVKERLDVGPKTTRPATPGSGSRPMPSIIGPDMVVTGNLSTPGEIHIEGQVDGDVTCAKLIIGAGGLIRGTVTAGSVKVHGKVDGAIDGEEVFLLAGSEVIGDIFQGTLEIAPGAQFEGAVRRRTGAPRPVAALEPPPPVAAPAPAGVTPPVQGKPTGAAGLEREGHFEPVEEPAATQTAKPAAGAAPRPTLPRSSLAKPAPAAKPEAAPTDSAAPEAAPPATADSVAEAPAPAAGSADQPKAAAAE